MKYESIQEAMKTEEGQSLYKLISKNFDSAESQSPRAVRNAIESHMTYLGSQHHIETLVWQILNHKHEVSVKKAL